MKQKFKIDEPDFYFFLGINIGLLLVSVTLMTLQLFYNNIESSITKEMILNIINHIGIIGVIMSISFFIVLFLLKPKK